VAAASASVKAGLKCLIALKPPPNCAWIAGQEMSVGSTFLALAIAHSPSLGFAEAGSDDSIVPGVVHVWLYRLTGLPENVGASDGATGEWRGRTMIISPPHCRG
jgi:hypothetical protein